MYNLGVEAFLAVVRTQNVSRAADQLNLAQSTVSKRLMVLEQEIGTTLLERGKGIKKIRLTHAGESFISLAERWQSLWRETQLLKSDSSNLALAIGTLDSFNYAIFPELHRALSQHQPKINLKIVTSHSPELYDLVDQRQVDVAFTLLERSHPNIIVEKYHAEPMVGLRVAKSPQSGPITVDPGMLDPNQELYVCWGLSYQLWHDRWWDPLCPGRIRLDTAQLVLTYLCNEKQWAIVPLSVARVAQRQGCFHIFNLSEAPPERICYKIVHKFPKVSTIQSLNVLDNYLDIFLTKTSSDKTLF